MSVGKYLERIGFDGDPRPDVDTLFRLQHAHLTSVPYENLDIYYRREFSLAYGAIYDKVVNRRRGGYCFELNGLFGWLLRQLGFRTEEYLGRWLKGEALAVPLRRHRVVKVLMEGRSYIADVGVGQRCPLEPLEFLHDVVQEREGVRYRIVREGLYNVVQTELDGQFINFYSFDDAPQENIGYIYAHYYCCNYPGSVFLHRIIVHMSTAAGRRSIATVLCPETGQEVPELRIDDGEASYLFSKEALFAALERYFGIIL